MLLVLALQMISANVEVGTLADNITSPRRTDTSVLYAIVIPACAVETQREETAVDLSLRTEQTIGEVDYRCNSANGFTRRISSANGGQLRRGDQGIPYFISQSGDGAVALPRVQLTSPVTDQVGGSAVLTNGSSGFFKVEVPNLPRGLIAGEYRDTVSIEITPN